MSQPTHDAELWDNDESYDSEGASDTTLEIDEVTVARARVEQTRAEMADTIEALKEKLEPQHLVEQAKETVREATIGKAQHVMDEAKDRAREAVDNVGYTARDYSTTIVDTIRANPIPAALIGIGVGWLVMSARKNNSSERRYNGERYYGPAGANPVYGAPTYGAQTYRAYGTPDYQTTDRYENPAAGTYGTYERTTDSNAGGLRDMAGRVQERAGEVVDRVQDRAGQIADRAGEMAGRVQDRAGELAGRVQDRAGRMVDRAGDVAGRVQETAAQASERARLQARHAATAVQHNVEENPLAVGAVALAVGAALGFLLPETQKEHELMGQTRDRVMDRAQTTAQQVGQKVQNVAREAVDTLKTQAQDQGLVPNKEEMNNLKQSASGIIDTTLHAAQQEAKSQGLIPSDPQADNAERQAA